jgi:hypothetical protein
MPHTVESTITYSAADYARGAVDLLPEEIMPLNSTARPMLNTTLFEAAVSIVKEAGPKVIEAISTHLMPVSTHQLLDMVTDSPAESGGKPRAQLPEVFISPPVETIVVVQPSYNTTRPTVTLAPETVNR